MSATEPYLVPYPPRGSLLGEPELNALSAVVRSQGTLSAGSYRTEFDRRFRDLVGSRHALSVTSGTVALALAVRLLGLRPRDEVIATPQTYKATIQPLLDLPVTVRFCDVEEDTLNADPASIEALIGPRTRAILIVHYGGLPADMDQIMGIARRHGIKVIEDCAHSLGSVYHGRRPGALGDIGCFSFHSSKIITTLGEGGMITVADDDWAERLERIRSNDSDGVYVSSARRFAGRADAPDWMLHPGYSYTHSCVELRHPGTNATLPEPSAAVGLAQLDRLESLRARRREIAGRITDVLAKFPFVRTVPERPGVVNAYHLYTFFLEPSCGADRDAVVDRLAQYGVEMQLRYFPLHLLPEWQARGHRGGESPVAERLWFTQQVNLPCQPGLSDRHVKHLLEALETVLSEVSAGAAALAAQ